MASIVSSSTASDEPEVDEPRRGHDGGRDRAAGLAAAALEGVDDRLGDGERRPPQGPGQLHRQVRGEVAVLGLGRPLDLDARRGWSSGHRGQVTGGRCRGPRRVDRVADARAHGPAPRWALSRGRIRPVRDRRHGPPMLAVEGSPRSRWYFWRTVREALRDSGMRVSSAGPDPSVTSRTAIACHSLCPAVDIREIGIWK